MTAPTVIPRWATATGSAVELSGLNVDSITLQSGVISRFAFSGSPDLSGVVVGFYLEVTGATNALNNGTFLISAVDNTAKWIEVINAAVLDATQDETGSPATADVLSNAAETATPSTAKQTQGWRSGERPPAGWLNWLAYWTGEWIDYFAGGGALPSYPNAAAVAADPAPANEAKILVAGLGLFEFDDSSALTADDITILGHSSGGDGRYLLIIGQGWSRYFADGAALKAIDTTPLDADCLYRATINASGLVREYIWIPTGSATAGEPTHYTPDDGPGFWAQVNEQAINYAPAVTTLAVNKTAHGFSALNVVRHNGTAWVAAQANTEAACIDCWVVSKNLDTNNFVAVKSGRVTIPAHGLTPGSTYYLSAASAGALVSSIPIGSTSVPLGFYLPVLYVVDADTVDIFGHGQATFNPVLAEYVVGDSNVNGGVTFSNLNIAAMGKSVGFVYAAGGAPSSGTNKEVGIRINGVSSGTGAYESRLYFDNGTNLTRNNFTSSNAGRLSFNSASTGTLDGIVVDGEVFASATSGEGITWMSRFFTESNVCGSGGGRLTQSQTNITSIEFFGSYRLEANSGNYIRLYRRS